MNLFKELEYCGFIKDISSDPKVFESFLGNEQVTVYCGFDLTAKSLQLGNLIPILNLRKFLRYGHKVIILLGNATTKIGDPSGRNDMRSMLSDKQIEENKRSILHCINKFIDLQSPNVLIVENFDWFKDINYISFLQEIGLNFTINKMINIDIVKQRLEKQIPMTFLEFNYMIMQGYDFYYLNKKYGCNLQIGGSDQWGNMIQGLELIRLKKNESFNSQQEIQHKQRDGVFLYTIPLLLRADGMKMGKTAGGAIWLHEDLLSSFDYFQYFRDSSDEDVIKFLKIFTDLEPKEISKYENYKSEELNKVKDILAFEATKMRDGEKIATECLEKSKKLFSKNEIDLDLINEDDFIQISQCRLTDLILITQVCDSKSKARNLIESGAVKINDEKILDIDYSFENLFKIKNNKFVLKIGKNKVFFIKITC